MRDEMKPSEEFLEALANEKKRLTREVAKINPQEPNAY